MMRKRLTKPSPKTALSGDQLQVLVTDLTEAKEGALVGGQTVFQDRIRLNF